MADYWTVKELAEAANLDPSRIRQLILGGEISAVKIANTWFIGSDVAQNWLMKHGSKNQPSSY